MIRADQHLHTNLSPDSQTPAADYAWRAADMGLTHITLTDHVDIGHHNPIFNQPPQPVELLAQVERLQAACDALAVQRQSQTPGVDLCQSQSTVQPQSAQAQTPHTSPLPADAPQNPSARPDPALQNAVASTQTPAPIRVGYGVELGYLASHHQQIQAYLAALDAARKLDFCLLSIHEVDGLDPYDPQYFEGRTRKAAYAAYLLSVLASVESGLNFHAVGHIGYVWKYTKMPDPVLHDAEFPLLLDRILTRIIGLDRALEINTSALATHEETLPPASILARYAQLGGRLITFGSDAHAPERMAAGFAQAAKTARECGLNEYAVFVEGEARMLKIR